MSNNPFREAGYTSDTLTQGYNQDYFDAEAQDQIEDHKYARQIRHGFLRKVYGIISIQLLITTAVGAYFTFSTTAMTFILSHYWIPLTAAILGIVLLLVLGCVPSASRSYPTNYILLLLFTVCEAISVGAACASASASSGGLIVLQAALATAIITCALTLFAFQTKHDFTSCAAIAYYITIAACTFAIFLVFFRNSTLMAGISAVFALLMCAHIVIDTQFLIGGGKISASLDDYILAAVMLYVDIINLFIHLLRLLEFFKGRN